MAAQGQCLGHQVRSEKLLWVLWCPGMAFQDLSPNHAHPRETILLNPGGASTQPGPSAKYQGTQGGPVTDPSAPPRKRGV